MVVYSQDVPERVPNRSRVRSVASNADSLRLQRRRGVLEILHMKLERARIGLGAQGHFRNLGCPPKGEPPSLRLDHGPDGTPFADHAEPEEIAVEGEGFLHVFHREEDMTDVLDDSHGPAMGLRRYMKRPARRIRWPSEGT